jgi:hypothetical protein
LLLTVVFSGFVCSALTGTTLSPTRLSVAVGASQFAFHSFFGMIGDGSPVATGLVMEGAHSHQLTPLVEGSTTVAMTAGLTAHHTNLAMWVGHALAAVATILILRHGEKAFWALRDFAVFALRSLFSATPPAVVPARPTVGTSAPRRRQTTPRILILLRTSLLYRGPPVLSIA